MCQKSLGHSQSIKIKSPTTTHKILGNLDLKKVQIFGVDLNIFRLKQVQH